MLCDLCDRNFSTKHSLASHKYSFHRPKDGATNSSTIAIVNSSSIPSRQIPRKRFPTPDPNEIRKRNKLRRILNSTSGESSDSDSSMDSSDDESETKTPRWVKIPVDNKTPVCKRNRSPDSSDDEPPSKAPKRMPIKYSDIHKYNKDPRENRKRMYIPETDEEDMGSKRIRNRSSTAHLNQLIEKNDEINEKRIRIEALETDNRSLMEKNNKCEFKVNELQDLLKKEQERVKLLSNQLNDLEDDDNEGMSAVEKALMNSVTIEQINNVRYLIKSGEIERVLNDNDNLVTIQRIFTAMLEGVIPVYNPQNLVFSKNQRQFMKNLERIGIDSAKDYILQNIEEFLKIFEALDMSLKLVTKSFNKYVQKSYK